jgi:hypothetical protein
LSFFYAFCLSSFLYLVLIEYFFCISISLTLFYFSPAFLSYRKKEMSFLLCSEKYFLLFHSFGVLILSPFHYFVSSFIYVHLYSSTSVFPCP